MPITDFFLRRGSYKCFLFERYVLVYRLSDLPGEHCKTKGLLEEPVAALVEYPPSHP
jgi:hypothetical protein